MGVRLPGFSGGDRTSLDLPQAQEELLEAVSAVGRPVVLVLMSGSALSVNWAAEHVPAIVQAWYPGEEGGTAVADLLFGDYNPAGRLPVTFYKSVDQLPPFEDYSMKGRTYRYFTGEPLYPFGYGLSYTRIQYTRLTLPSKIAANRTVNVGVEMQNTGDRDGDEVVELYVSHLNSSAVTPIRTLAGVKRISLKAHERRRFLMPLDPRMLTVVKEDGQRIQEPGEIEISVGGEQPGFKGRLDAATTSTITRKMQITGPAVPFAP